MRSIPPWIIAHRGASAYLPEHTLEAKSLAVGQGADFLEQDVVSSRDGVALVLHDVVLDDTTDAARVFPERARADGHHYAVDFDWEELRRLRVHERYRSDAQAVYPTRFPPDAALFRLHTLAEELTLVRGLERSLKTRIGVYPELKAVGWHHEQGIDLPALVVPLLRQFGYDQPGQPIFVQCFEAQGLEDVSGLGWRGERVLLLQPQTLSGLAAEEGRLEARLRSWREIASVLGPSITDVVEFPQGGPQPRPLVTRVREAGLRLHPYTLRRDDLPPGAPDFAGTLRCLFDGVGAEAVFTDFPDLASRVLALRGT